MYTVYGFGLRLAHVPTHCCAGGCALHGGHLQRTVSSQAYASSSAFSTATTTPPAVRNTTCRPWPAEAAPPLLEAAFGPMDCVHGLPDNVHNVSNDHNFPYPQKYHPRASVIPASLDLTDCPRPPPAHSTGLNFVCAISSFPAHQCRITARAPP